MFESVAEVINRCSVLLRKWRAAHQESGRLLVYIDLFRMADVAAVHLTSYMTLSIVD